MTAEPSLFEKIVNEAFYPELGRIYAKVDHELLRSICAEYEKRLADLEASNRNMASRLQKLMEKKK